MLAEMVEGLPLPTVLISADERILMANPPGRALFGDGAIGRHYVLFMRQPGLLDAIEGTRTHRHVTRARYILSGAAGETVFRVTVAPAPGGAVMCSFEDISEMEKAGLMRRDFVANVSHELRTPLTSLLGFIETLQGAAKEDPAARTRFLSIMAREAERMNRLVSDLLSLSRVESEERVRPTTPSDIVSLVASAVTALRPTAISAGAEIVVTGARDPVMVPADPDQMTQVFQNLIENAIKYGASGGTITVDVKKDDTDTQRLGPTVLISVSDKGDGIDPIHIPRLTERFYRVDNHRSREMGGTGLGLAIVKHIVNRHRGRFRITSRKGEGSTFTIILPQT
ncbi:sensor histidine kinase [Falsirhodobacter halotolerans]|uniref:sensor histidine kinase n=1 Tax=Falsirhodobacter halotolerans TaxID=1146892 RepID=UPI003CC802E8